jgi:hypothetical protein
MMILAYIDPGSGALVWQIAVAGVMGFLFYASKVRALVWRGITSLFRVGNKNKTGPDGHPSQKD